MSYHIIETMADIEQGVQSLSATCPLMLKAYEKAGLPPLRRNENNFKSLSRTVTGQLLSVASASAIWARVEQLAQPFEAGTILSLAEQPLKKAGLSNAKIRTLKALASAIQNDEIDFARFETEPENLVREQLVRVHGIGPWTADIYVMFCLGRADGFAPGDVALANATGRLKKMPKRPTPSQLTIIARQWSPWRGVAARLLWHYYAVVKNVKTETDR